MFPVEIRLVERTEQTSTARISSIQKWLDNQGFEPSTFRYTFFQDGLVLRVDFALQPEAVAFADEFEWLGAHLTENMRSYEQPNRAAAEFWQTDPDHQKFGDEEPRSTASLDGSN